MRKPAVAVEHLLLLLLFLRACLRLRRWLGLGLQTCCTTATTSWVAFHTLTHTLRYTRCQTRAAPWFARCRNQARTCQSPVLDCPESPVLFAPLCYIYIYNASAVSTKSGPEGDNLINMQMLTVVCESFRQ